MEINLGEMNQCMPCIECDREERDSLDRSDMEVSSDLLPPLGGGALEIRRGGGNKIK